MPADGLAVGRVAQDARGEPAHAGRSRFVVGHGVHCAVAQMDLSYLLVEHVQAHRDGLGHNHRLHFVEPVALGDADVPDRTGRAAVAWFVVPCGRGVRIRVVWEP